MPFSRIRPPSELASGVSNATTTGLSFGSNWNVTCAIQAVAIEPPRLSASKRPDTASIAPASGSVALVFHRSRIIQANGLPAGGALGLGDRRLGRCGPDYAFPHTLPRRSGKNAEPRFPKPN